MKQKKVVPEWDRTTPSNKKSENFMHTRLQRRFDTTEKMNRIWIQEPCISDEYEKGVEDFLEFSRTNAPVVGGKFFCPCVNCVNGRRHSLNEI